MRRREFVVAGAAALARPFIAGAQQPVSPFRVGFLSTASAASYADRIDALRAGLRDLSYVEGKNLILETRWAAGHYDRLVTLAVELLDLKIDVIVTHGTPGIQAAMQATTTVPIIMAASGDAVSAKLVASLARPGGNVTGTSFFSPELHAKRLELLKGVLPQLTRAAYLINPANLALVEPEVQRARSMKIGLELFETRTPNDFESAFFAMGQNHADAVIVQTDAIFSGNLSAVARLAATQHLPSAGDAEFARAGGLLGYGPNFVEMYRHTAYFVDKIAKGTKPGDLPVEQPTKFDIVVNLKTAKTLGLTVPPSLLALADEVIE